MFDLPMPPPYDGWDPLLQRRVVVTPSAAYPSTPAAATKRVADPRALTKPTQGPSSGALMPPPPPRDERSRRSSAESTAAPQSVASASTRSPATPLDAPAPLGPLSPSDMEQQSLALAYQLQREEHAAFAQAVRASSPTQAAAQGMDTAAAGDDELDESLRLAIQLQQEELTWHAAAASGGGDEDVDEDHVRLAMELSQQQEDDRV